MRLYQLFDNLKIFLIWALNGVLILLFQLWTVKWAAFIVILTIFMSRKLSRWIGEHEESVIGKWVYASFFLLIIVSSFLPEIHSFLCSLIVLSSMIAIRLDRFHPAQTAWKLVYGAVGYFLISAGYLLFNYFLSTSTTMDGFLIQGQNYLGVLGGILLYLYPAGYLALLFKDLLLHKPQMEPIQIMSAIRREGSD